MRAWKTLAFAGAFIAGCAENKPPQTAYHDGTAHESHAEATVTQPGPTTEPQARTIEESPTASGPATEGPTREPLNSPSAPSTILAPAAGKTAAADNTRVNKRDTDDNNLTPMDQGNSEGDRNITAGIRKAVVADGSLSFTAKNVKIITKDGNVVLRGPVKTDTERAAIAAAATRVAGAGRVNNQIEIAK